MNWVKYIQETWSLEVLTSIAKAKKSDIKNKTKQNKTKQKNTA